MPVIDSRLIANMDGEGIVRPSDGVRVGAPHPFNVIKVGRVTIDLSAHQVYCGEEEVSLTPKEYQLLIFFTKNPRCAVSVEEIRERVWRTPQPVSSKAVGVTVSRLRKKLDWYDELKAVWKVGYRLDLDPLRQ